MKKLTVLFREFRRPRSSRIPCKRLLGANVFHSLKCAEPFRVFQRPPAGYSDCVASACLRKTSQSAIVGNGNPKAPQGQARREPASPSGCAGRHGQCAVERRGTFGIGGVEAATARGEGEGSGSAQALEFTSSKSVELRTDYRRDVRSSGRIWSAGWLNAQAGKTLCGFLKNVFSTRLEIGTGSLRTCNSL